MSPKPFAIDRFSLSLNVDVLISRTHWKQRIIRWSSLHDVLRFGSFEDWLLNWAVLHFCFGRALFSDWRNKYWKITDMVVPESTKWVLTIAYYVILFCQRFSITFHPMTKLKEGKSLGLIDFAVRIAGYQTALSVNLITSCWWRANITHHVL